MYFDGDSSYFLKKPEAFLKFKEICALRRVTSPEKKDALTDAV